MRRTSCRKGGGLTCRDARAKRAVKGEGRAGALRAIKGARLLEACPDESALPSRIPFLPLTEMASLPCLTSSLDHLLPLFPRRHPYLIMANHSESELKALKVADLKELCTARSLPTTGRKDELIARLLESDVSRPEPLSSSRSRAEQDLAELTRLSCLLPAPALAFELDGCSGRGVDRGQLRRRRAGGSRARRRRSNVDRGRACRLAVEQLRPCRRLTDTVPCICPLLQPAAAEPPTTAATSHAAVTDAPATADTAASVDDAGTKAVESEAADAKAKADADEIERQKRRAARFGIVR